MQILFAIKALGNTGGGAERILAAISGSLAERGHNVTVLTFDRAGTQDFYRVSSQIDRIRLGIGVTTARSGPLVTAVRLRQLRRVAKQLQPDVAIGFMHSSFVPLALALVGTGIPV